MAKTELERLVAVETKMDTVIEGVKDLQHKFDQVMPTVVNHTQFSEFKEATAIELAELKKEFEKVTSWLRKSALMQKKVKLSSLRLMVVGQ